MCGVCHIVGCANDDDDDVIDQSINQSNRFDFDFMNWREKNLFFFSLFVYNSENIHFK